MSEPLYPGAELEEHTTAWDAAQRNEAAERLQRLVATLIAGQRAPAHRMDYAADVVRQALAAERRAGYIEGGFTDATKDEIRRAERRATVERLDEWLVHKFTCPAFREQGGFCDCGLDEEARR